MRFNQFLLRTAMFVFMVGYLGGCQKGPKKDVAAGGPAPPQTAREKFPGIPKSDIYKVTIVSGSGTEELTVFQNNCPVYSPGFEDMQENDRFPLEIFAGRSISWTKFTFSGSVTVRVQVTNRIKVPAGEVRILPSRFSITAHVQGEVVEFTISQPGQFSVEIGDAGYKNGLILFADPKETQVPNPQRDGYANLEKASATSVKSLGTQYSGIFFKNGVHDIGVYHLPSHIKNIYFQEDAWVYGALVMDGRPDVRIFGRGVLSSGRLKYRESHCIEAINQSNNIQIDGIVVADPKYFAVRLIGQNNKVSWTKVIGGWVYNCDGIAAYANSSVSNCFIWANDDAIKIYRNNIKWTDCVVWQLNNGGVIQMAWGGSNADNVVISGLDVLRAEWNKPGFNRGLLNCVGNRYHQPDKTGRQTNWLIENVVTEHPVPVIFNITPDPFSHNHIHGLTIRNWKVKMPMDTNFKNEINGNDPAEPLDGFTFENINFNGIKLTGSNWLEVTGLQTKNLVTPDFK